MRLREDQSDQKLRGGYYTPEKLAEFIVSWSIEDNEINNDFKILEPSCGDGVFLTTLQKCDRDFSCTAVEIDESEYSKAKDAINEDSRFSIVNTDFYSFYEENKLNKYDLVIGNPPYIRYQYLSDIQRDEQSDILLTSGLKPNKLINSWVSFTIASIQMLRDTGKIGFVIPAELLQVKYAEQLRAFLMDQLSSIRIITFKTLVFPGVEQEVVLLLGEKGISTDGVNKIKTLQFDDLDDLIENYSKKDNSLVFQDIDLSSRKWTRYFLNPEENNLLNKILKDDKFHQFHEIGKVDIGITTGNNSFFCVDQLTASKYDLERISRPLIARSVNIPSVTFNKQDWKNNISYGARTFLLDFNNISENELSKEQKLYINKGTENGEHLGYKTRIRKVWYQIPSIWVPDAFFLRRNHHYPKFVLNELSAVSTDTMHRIKFHEGVNPKKIILSYYNSISFAFTELEARSYGGGVLEVLPGELENITIPNFQNRDIPENVVQDIFSNVDRMMREDIKNIDCILDYVDNRVLIDIFDMDPQEIASFRAIWKKLKDRRLGRN